MEESIPVPNLINENPNSPPPSSPPPPQLGFDSSPPKSDLDPLPSDLNHTTLDEQQLQNLHLEDAEDNNDNTNNYSDKEEQENGDIQDDDDDHEEEQGEEESGSDDNVKRSTNEKDNGNGNGNGNDVRRRYSYPVRPEAEDCSYYMKTGTCKFGSNCKFNHPVRRKNQPSKERVKEREESIEGHGQSQNYNHNQNHNQSQNQSQSQIECKYYLRTGGCKYGESCRYNHTRARSAPSPILELNFLGLPIRLGEKECPYYMRNGSCKYGANCRFNHPDPTAVGNSDPPSGYGNGGSVPSQTASQASMGSWSSPRALNETAPFVPMMYSPTQAVPPQSPEWNGYQAPLYPPPERSMHPAPAYVMNNPSIETNVYTNHQQQMLVDEFPERPGQPECSFFLKTGDCKFKSNCKYHHPRNRVSKSTQFTLSDKGLPLRPDQNICSHYSRYGICKFGPACKFDHPIHATDASTESGPDPPLPYDNSAATEEVGAAGTGNGSSNEIQQPV